MKQQLEEETVAQENDSLVQELAKFGITIEQIRYLVDRQAILDCIRRYARGIDRHDEELIQSAFWPDAQINYGNYSGLPPVFAKWGNDGHDIAFRAHLHSITTQTAEIDGDVAHVESYVIFMLLGHNNVVNVGGGRYIELFERRHGEWRIAIREFVVDVMFRADAAELQWLDDPLTTHDRTDLSYARPLERRPAPGRPLKEAMGPNLMSRDR
jgi:hypothetical protein